MTVSASAGWLSGLGVQYLLAFFGVTWQNTMEEVAILDLTTGHSRRITAGCGRWRNLWRQYWWSAAITLNEHFRAFLDLENSQDYSAECRKRSYMSVVHSSQLMNQHLDIISVPFIHICWFPWLPFFWFQFPSGMPHVMCSCRGCMVPNNCDNVLDFSGFWWPWQFTELLSGVLQNVPQLRFLGCSLLISSG